MDQDILYLSALKHCPHIGESIIKKIISKFGSAKKAWFASSEELLTIYQIGKKTIQYIGDKSTLNQAYSDIEYCIKNNIQIVHLWEAKYPKMLKECTDAPVLLYHKGNINWDLPALSIVGTRKMTSYGKDFTEKLVECFQNKKINIISGLALGIDGCAHKKAYELKIPTLGVLAHGLKNLYPTQHKLLAEKIAENGGIITEFPPNINPERANFIQRNRIIAGLSLATIIVESAYGGGAISTVKFANSYNREVFALPGKITDHSSQGCNQLIRNLEAQIITRPEDIISLYHENTQKHFQTRLFTDLSATESIIIDYLREKGKTQIDILSDELKIPTHQLMHELLNLELKNLIDTFPGKYYNLT
ncbi:DNA-processing protein DprA [Apibacter raozihei]|uniref:DNA-processing protein DprA n=1 Tax=Apibacter raozihei TaxID=2500547 RepID=UPI000FE2E964|nr:DNA-processing protein DprA [Apibacter raozihei]